MGIQDAARKRQPPSLTPGPWAGAVVHADRSVTKSITQEKWNKVKRILKDLRGSIGSKECRKALDRKTLESDRRFFTHVSMTYEIITPFLQGFHNTIDGWRENRNEDGWKEDNGSSQ